MIEPLKWISVLVEKPKPRSEPSKSASPPEAKNCWKPETSSSCAAAGLATRAAAPTMALLAINTFFIRKAPNTVSIVGTPSHGIVVRTRPCVWPQEAVAARSEEHTSELQSLMRISYAVFCLQKKIRHTILT